MSKTAKIGLLAATAWPIVYIVLFTGFVFSMMLQTSSAGQAQDWFAPLMVVHLLTMLWCMALTAIYIVNVFGNDRVEKDKKALWAVVLFFGSILAMVVYWYLYIWRETPAPAR
jgi:hypothetical protein